MGLIKSVKRTVKKITKPVAKVLDKIVPNEIKPFLPYAAAFVPFAAPASFGIGSLSPMVSRALLSGGANLAAQLSQEGSEGDFSGLSALLAAGTGYLSTPGAADQLRGMTAAGQTDKAGILKQLEAAPVGTSTGSSGFLGSAKDFVLNTGAKAAEALNVSGEGIGSILAPGGTPAGFNMETLSAAAVPFTQGSIDLGIATARKALQDYEAELAAFNAQAGANQAASDADRRAAIIASMTRADFTQDVIDETLGQLGLKDGGRVGYQAGGVASLQDFRNALQKVGAGTAMDQQRQIKDFARNEVQREIGAAVKGDNFRDFLMQNVGAGGASIYGGLYGSPGNPQGPFTGTFQSMRDSLIDQITRQRLNAPEPGPFIERDSLTGLPVTDLLPNNPDGLMKSLAEQDTIRDRVLAAQQAQEESYYLTDPISGKTYKSQDEAIEDLGLVTYNQRFADGGIARLGFDNGGDVSFGGITEAVENVAKEPKKFLVDKLEVTVQPGQSEKMAIVNAMFNDVDDVMPEDRKAEFYKLYLPQLKDSGEISQNDYNSLIKELNLIELDKDYKVTKDPKLIKFIDKLQPAAEGIDNLLKKVGIDVDKMRTKPNIRKAKGGLASLKDGGIMDLGGKEMDMRTGGFIPIGAKERADDVPARLSKNEFVMTADAVRAAGGGSVNKGAKRMYDLMHNLEARA